MSPVLRALVDADNQRPGPSDIDRKRVYATLGVSLGVLPLGAAAAAHAAGAGAAASAASASGGTAVATAVGAASAVGRVALLVKAPLVSIGVGAVLGAALTAYVVKGPAARWTASARARRAAAMATAPQRASAPLAPEKLVAPQPPTAAPAAAVVAPAEAPAPVGERPAKITSSRHAVAAPAAPREEDLGRPTDDARTAAPLATAGVLSQEQALLDPARASLAHGDGAGALARLALHERRFPNGALAQEREAMTIRALVLTGDRDRARARAAAFRSRYPGSLLWPMIAASLDASPGSRR
jgi:hypothetical protein